MPPVGRQAMSASSPRSSTRASRRRASPGSSASLPVRCRSTSRSTRSSTRARARGRGRRGRGRREAVGLARGRVPPTENPSPITNKASDGRHHPNGESEHRTKLRAAVGRTWPVSVRSVRSCRWLLSVIHCLVPMMARTTEETGFLRQKTQVGGRSNRTTLARVAVCSALGGEPSGSRANPERATATPPPPPPPISFLVTVSTVFGLWNGTTRNPSGNREMPRRTHLSPRRPSSASAIATAGTSASAPKPAAPPRATIVPSRPRSRRAPRARATPGGVLCRGWQLQVPTTLIKYIRLLPRTRNGFGTIVT